MSTIKINELATTDIALTDFIAKADANGLMTKNTVSNLSAFFETVGEVGFKGSVLIADDPTEDGWYLAGEAGTFPNIGGLVALAQSVTIFVISDSDTTYSKIDIPLTLPFDSVPTQGSINAVTSDGINTAISNASNLDNRIPKDNLIPNNYYDNELEGWEIETFYGANLSANPYDSNATITVEFDSTLQQNTFKVVGNKTNSSQNTVGILIPRDKFSLGSVLTFKGLVKKSLDSDNIKLDIRALNRDGVHPMLRGSAYTRTINQTTTDWIEMIDSDEFTVPSDSDITHVLITIKTFSQNESVSIAGWSLTEDIEITEDYPKKLSPTLTIDSTVKQIPASPFAVANEFNNKVSIKENLFKNNNYSQGFLGWDFIIKYDDNLSVNPINSNTTTTIEYDETVNSYIRKTVGNDTNNYTGSTIDVSKYAVGTVFNFRGKFKKSLSTDQITLQLRNYKDDGINPMKRGDDVEVEYFETSSDWIEIKNIEISKVADSDHIVIRLQDFSQNESLSIVDWSFEEKTSQQYGYNYTPFSNLNPTLYVSKNNSSDLYIGDENSPLETIQEALNRSRGKVFSKIIVTDGDYRESLNTDNLVGNENFEIHFKNGARHLGSEKLENFTKTTGYTNIYEASFTGLIAEFPHELGKQIFEDGRNDKEILDKDRTSFHKGLDYFLPHTAMKEESFDQDLATTLSNLDALKPITVSDQVNVFIQLQNNIGRFYHDSSNDKIYIHTTDSDNPTSNGFSYEIPVSTTWTSTIEKDCSIKLFNYQVGYSTEQGFRDKAFKSVFRNNCIAFGNLSNGFYDSFSSLESFFDETFLNGNDGINGTVPSPGVNSDATNDEAKLRINIGKSVYNNAWCHHNGDEGISHHQLANTVILGSLFEFNGSAGLTWATGGNVKAFNCISRFNGTLKNIDSVADGLGFSVIGTDGQNFGRESTIADLYNCISYENYINYQSHNTNIVNLYNCVGRDAIEVELSTSFSGSIINAFNFVYSLSNTGVINSGTGTLNTTSDTLLT